MLSTEKLEERESPVTFEIIGYNNPIIENAARLLSRQLLDTLPAITPDTKNQWLVRLSSGDTLLNPTIPADTVRIYLDTKPLLPAQAAIAAAAGYSLVGPWISSFDPHPRVGNITLNSTYTFTDNQLTAIVQHEILHVLGIIDHFDPKTDALMVPYLALTNVTETDSEALTKWSVKLTEPYKYYSVPYITWEAGEGLFINNKFHYYTENIGSGRLWLL